MKKYPNFDQKISVSKNNEKKTAVIHTFFSLLVKFFCNIWQMSRRIFSAIFGAFEVFYSKNPPQFLAHGEILKICQKHQKS